MDQPQGKSVLGVYRNHRGAARNSAIFVTVLLFVVGLFSYTFLKDTSWFLKHTLFERESASYRPYLQDEFDGYDENSEALNQSGEDLSRWQKAGSITGWVDIADWQKVDQIDLVLTDSSGKSVTLEGIENLKISREENKIKSDDPFPNAEFNCEQKLTSWEDFLLVNGTNFVFWEFDKNLGIDMAHIASWQAVDGDVVMPVNDLVIHDGLCDDVNSLNGLWHTPNGLPQYGVWWPQNGQLRMRNVEQEQYPSNGDHVRILSSLGTPQNFILKTRFTVLDLGKDLENTYIRLAWDFDDQFDPGHDETIVYNTFKYKYLGLQRVFPIQRYFQQGNEPQSSDMDAKTRFAFKKGHTYEIDVKVEGKDTWVEVYEIKKNFFVRKAKLNYSFKKERPVFSYPFAMETTGNVEVSLDSFEVWNK